MYVQTTCRILMASSRAASWFMSIAWIASPLVKMTAWFWLFGLPSPTLMWPGSCRPCDGRYGGSR